MNFSEQYFFVVNPKAAGGRSGRSWDTLFNHLQASGLDFDFVVTTRQGETSDVIQSAFNQGFRRFVSVGGDGSLNEVVNGLMLHCTSDLDNCSIAVFPVGTGNDWSAHHGLPHDYDAFIDMLKSPTIVRQDIGRVEYDNDGAPAQHYFANFVGAGFDSYLLQQMGSAQGNRWKYFAYVLKCLKAYKGPVVSLCVEGRKVDVKKVMMFMGCIGRFGGAGMKFAPSADSNDGVFNILRITDMPILRRVASLMYLYNGKVNDHPMVDTWLSDHFTVSADKPLHFQCDGELIGLLPIDVTTCKGVLKVIVP